MTLRLVRQEYRNDGIFSTLLDEKGKIIAHTLEHSFDDQPKLYAGTFECVRGIHRLHDLRPFETFEIMGVIHHTGILFHVGNWNDDSDGCVLIGSGIASSSKGQMITGSRLAFNSFMDLLTGEDKFTLEVVA